LDIVLRCHGDVDGASVGVFHTECDGGKTFVVDRCGLKKKPNNNNNNNRSTKGREQV
jgi:hypothetical protein